MIDTTRDRMRRQAIAARQVNGMAWVVYDRYSKPSSPLYPLQEETQAAGRGR